MADYGAGNGLSTRRRKAVRYGIISAMDYARKDAEAQRNAKICCFNPGEFEKDRILELLWLMVGFGCRSEEESNPKLCYFQPVCG